MTRFISHQEHGSTYSNAGGGITMVGDTANRPVGLESTVALETSAFAGMRAAPGMRVLLKAVVAVSALTLMAATANAWVTYTVNTLDDSSGNGDCSLRDAINAANGTPTSGSTCTTAGRGDDTIQFSVTGTIALTSTLPN